MVSVEFSECITETLDILKHMENSYIEKIPRKFMVFLENNKSTNYISNLDHSKKVNEMILKEKTKDILAIIYMKYWCTEEEKHAYNELLQENEKKYQDELRKKYNVDNIFQKTNQFEKTMQNNITNNVAIVEYKESIFKKLINKIKNIFNNN